MIKNYGFHPENIVIEPDHYHLGAARSLAADVVMPDADWTPFAPDFEGQDVGFETDGCTVFGTYHCLAGLERHAFGAKPDYAERFTYINAGVSPDGGGDPHAVAESIRTQGVVPQAELPMTATLDEFARPNPMTKDLLSEGWAWVGRRSFGHEWVFTGGRPQDQRTALIRQALQYSPVGMSVSAWMLGPNGTYIDGGNPNNHWVSCFKDNGNGWLVFDSYKEEWKVIDYAHDVQFCKRYSLSAASPAPAKSCSLFKRLLSGLKYNDK